MATVWQFEYNDGDDHTVTFDRQECERRVTRKNCAMDVQRFKNGLVRIYSGPSVWDSFVLTFRHIGWPTHGGDSTIDKIDQLASVQVPIKFYYRKHRDDSYKYVNMVPAKRRKYSAGGLSTENVTLELIETNTPS